MREKAGEEGEARQHSPHSFCRSTAGTEGKEGKERHARCHLGSCVVAAEKKEEGVAWIGEKGKGDEMAEGN